MNCKGYILSSLFLLCSLQLFAAVAWEAQWISHPKLDPHAYTVLHFRNTFTVDAIPQKMPLLLSADIRYKLYVNGTYVGQGPANNDLKHYVFDELDIAPYLRSGNNILALQVFSLGKMNPLRYETGGAKLLVQGPEAWGKQLNTGSGNWKVLQNKAYSPTERGKDFNVISYYAMGGGEKIDAALHTWNWQNLQFDDQHWEKAVEVQEGENYGNPLNYGNAELSLQPRNIPAMDESPETRPVLRSAQGVSVQQLAGAWQKEQALQIPANTAATILLDQSYLTKGHPFFHFSGGKGARVKISYAETLFIKNKEQGHRDSIAGKSFIGLADIYLLDGGKDREFTSLLPRVWRYIQLEIQTGSEPLSWNQFRATRFLYPFQEKAQFNSSLPLHQQIWKAGWRTARLCADETYMDCPYYEQLQYIGDTRIQALISLYVSGDDRLMKNAIDQFAHSITDEGITQSRFPSRTLQYIPPYSLFWINMLHDYHMHRSDAAYTRQYLHQVASVLFWFERKLREDKLLGPMPWWSYVDWVESWPKSSPPGSTDGGSVMLTLQYVYALQDAIALFQYHQNDTLSRYFSNLKNEIQQAVAAKAFHPQKQLFADTPAQNSFSQHTNIMAILTDTAPKAAQAAIFDRITTEPGITKTNIYFTFYLHRAAQKAGRGNYFLANLDIWKNMLQRGLSTFAESAENTRSDCHAWSASPNYEFLSLVCGILPAAPHFSSISIAPNPGSLKKVSGKMPHPQGEIAVDFTFNKQSVSGEVVVPAEVEAHFYWQGKEIKLQPGKNKIRL